jgi:hypothetical protein|tara:strand:- start:2472 stop:5027 length:2556 start_codon:yes stop_codon:yes gene_type:complete
MAIEKNPFESEKEKTNVIELPQNKDSQVSFEIEPDGGLTVDFESVEVEMQAEPEMAEFYGNMVENLDDDTLADISAEVRDKFQADKESRADWESMFERGFDLLGLKIQDAVEPFEGACTAVHPLLIESAVKFQSKASQELFPPAGPVKSQILGKVTPDKEKQANRVQGFMNYQLTEQMPEYFDEFERMLFHLPLIGSAIKKIYYDETLKRPVSEFIPIDQFYVSYFASNLRNAERYTHVIYKNPVDLQKDIASGVYVDAQLPMPSNPTLSSLTEKMDTILGLNPSYDNDPQHVLLEQHTFLTIEDEDEPLPYIVTVEQESGVVLSIRRNYSPESKTKEKRNHFVHYRFVPGFGFYGLGLMHFLGNLTMTATAAMRSLVDAGQFANLPGGFKAKGVRMVGDNEPIAPGEFKEIEATGVDLSKAIIPLPYKEPSSTLYQMLNFVAQAGQKFADSTEQIVSDAASYGPVGTTMALLEASSKFFTAIHKRIHKSQRDEFKILARIDYEYLPSEYPYEVPNEDRSVFKSDFDGKIDVIPVSDPNIPSNAHRMMLANMALQMAQQSPPGMFNIQELNRTILHSANMPNLENILPQKPESQPLDPISDIIAATKGIPVKAFPGQNHDAHIKVKTAYLQDPRNGANPIMARIVPVLQANIQEHSILLYQEQISGMTKVGLEQLTPEQQQVPNVGEIVMANAAQQILNANKAMGMVQSPEQQMVALEQAKVELEKEKLKVDAAVQNAKMALETKELDLKENELLVDAASKKVTNTMKGEKAQSDRISKEQIKSLEMLTKLAIEESRVKASEGQNALRLLNELVRDEEKDKTKREIASAKLMADAMKLDEQTIKGGKDGTK